MRVTGKPIIPIRLQTFTAKLLNAAVAKGEIDSELVQFLHRINRLSPRNFVTGQSCYGHCSPDVTYAKMSKEEQAEIDLDKFKASMPKGETHYGYLWLYMSQPAFALLIRDLKKKNAHWLWELNIHEDTTDGDIYVVLTWGAKVANTAIQRIEELLTRWAKELS